jgi:hypothetical protein
MKLLDLLHHPSPAIRESAITTIGRVGDEATLEALVEARARAAFDLDAYQAIDAAVYRLRVRIGEAYVRPAARRLPDLDDRAETRHCRPAA